MFEKANDIYFIHRYDDSNSNINPQSKPIYSRFETTRRYESIIEPTSTLLSCYTKMALIDRS